MLSISPVFGVPVDDNIVEIKDVMRHLRMGKTSYEAAMMAGDEIGMTVIATTFTLFAGFGLIMATGVLCIDIVPVLLFKDFVPPSRRFSSPWCSRFPVRFWRFS